MLKASYRALLDLGLLPEMHVLCGDGEGMDGEMLQYELVFLYR